MKFLLFECEFIWLETCICKVEENKAPLERDSQNIGMGKIYY